MSQSEIFTIGHSNHPVDQFVGLLRQHGVESLVDIRRFPTSRRYPQFNQPNLTNSLAEQDIGYHWLEALGGRRGRRSPDFESPNFGIKDESFRNYADYMLTDDFQAGIEKLLDIAKQQRTAIMCAEVSFLQCHRRLVSDYLMANGLSVQHILPTGELQPHILTSGAQMTNGGVTYPEVLPLFDALD